MKKKAPVNEKTMVRRQVFLARDQAEFLKVMSKATDRSKAFIMRAALREYAEKRGVTLEPEPERDFG